MGMRPLFFFRLWLELRNEGEARWFCEVRLCGAVYIGFSPDRLPGILYGFYPLLIYYLIYCDGEIPLVDGGLSSSVDVRSRLETMVGMGCGGPIL